MIAASERVLRRIGDDTKVIPPDAFTKVVWTELSAAKMTSWVRRA